MRLSRDDENYGDSVSIETQRTILQQYAKEQGLHVVGEYVDDGWSGTNFERPDFQRMMDDVEAGKVNCIVTKDLSRFGREHVMMDYYLEFLFPEKRVRYIAVAENEDTEKGLSDFVPFKNLFNEWFAKDTSRKVKAAFKAKFATGQRIGAYAPIGYRKHPEIKNKLIIDEETRWIVEKIFVRLKRYSAERLTFRWAAAANTQYTDIRFRGVWNSSTRYYYATASSIGLTNYENPSNAYVRDQVIYKGGVYLVKYVNSGGVYGQTPSSSSAYWELVSSVSAMAINTLLADNAVLGAFHFSNNVFWSGDGGSSSSAAKLYMNSSTGEFRAESATIKGNITATSGTFTGTVNATSGTFTSGTFTNCTTTNLTINSGTLKMSSSITSSLGTPSQAYSITTTTNITGSGFSILSATSSNDLIRATFGSKVVSVYNSSYRNISALAAIAIDGYYISGRNTVTVPLYISAASDNDAAIFVDNGAFYGWNLPVMNISALINGVTFSCVCNVTSSGYTMALNQGKVGTMVFMSVSNGYTYTIRRDSCAWISSTGVYQSAGTSSTTYDDNARIFIRVAYNTWQEYYVG